MKRYPPSDDFVMVASSPSIMIDDAATIEENETVFSATNMQVVKCGFVDYSTIKDGCTYTISRASAKEAVKLYGETALDSNDFRDPEEESNSEEEEEDDEYDA